MEKSLFEQMGGTYTLVGDYYLPNLLPVEQEEKLSVYGDSGDCGISNSSAEFYTSTCS